MKVAILSAIPLFPEGEGHRSRILALTRAVRALGHDLHFILVPSPFPGSCDLQAHRDEFEAGRFVALDREVETTTYPGLVHSLLHRLPFRIRRKISHKFNLSSKYYDELDGLYSQEYISRISEINKSESFDVVIVEYVFYSYLLESFPDDVLKIIDTHDSFADRHKPYIARGMSESYWISLAPEDELRGLRRADAILAIQHEEARKFSSKLTGRRSAPAVYVVSHVLDVSNPIKDYSPNKVVFLGSNNPSNVFSVNSFIKNVVPLIVCRIPDFKLVLAGSICESIADHPAIDKIGMVASVRDAFEKAPASINPTLMGTGINIKLLDAMAAGVSTVSTSTGVRGLPEDYRDSVVVAADEDYEAFADAVVAMVSREDLRAEMGRRAYMSAVRWNEVQSHALSVALERLSE